MDDNTWYNSLPPEDQRLARERFRAARNFNNLHKKRFPCPTCGTENAISAYEKAKGYHCANCTRLAES